MMPARPPAGEEQRLLDLLTGYLGPMWYHLEYPDRIEATGLGKLRWTINRTRQSAAPFAEAADVEISLFAPGDNEGLAEQLRSEQSGRTALVVGHSNTLPAWMTALGVEHDLAIDGSEYDNLFIVHLDELGRATMTHLHF